MAELTDIRETVREKHAAAARAVAGAEPATAEPGEIEIRETRRVHQHARRDHPRPQANALAAEMIRY